GRRESSVRARAPLNQRARFCFAESTLIWHLSKGASTPRRAEPDEPPHGRTPGRRGLWPLEDAPGSRTVIWPRTPNGLKHLRRAFAACGEQARRCAARNTE